MGAQVLWRLLVIVVAVIYILLGGYWIWQLVEASKADDHAAVACNVIMAAILIFVAILAVIGAIWRKKCPISTFAFSNMVILLLSIIELVLAIIAKYRCDDMGSGDPEGFDKVLHYLCEREQGSLQLIIPLAILIGISLCGFVFSILLLKSIKDEKEKKNSNYYS
eukprot:m51a1_g14667 hypothetical protein (165) ;mRNA; r:28095-29038